MENVNINIKINSIVKISSYKSDSFEFRHEKKNQVGIVLKTGKSLGKDVYWIKFKNTYNWLYKKDLVLK